MRRLGPGASWMLEDEDDDTVYVLVRQRTIDMLKKILQARMDALDNNSESADDVVMLEIRRSVAECAVSGHLTLASDLHDLAVELLGAKEHARRL